MRGSNLERRTANHKRRLALCNTVCFLFRHKRRISLNLPPLPTTFPPSLNADHDALNLVKDETEEYYMKLDMLDLAKGDRKVESPLRRSAEPIREEVWIVPG